MGDRLFPDGFPGGRKTAGSEGGAVFSEQAHVIHTGADGELVSTTPADIDAMVEAICRTGKAVLHFHGGLVPERAGRAAARRLFDPYQAAGAYPVFFVWRSGLLEVVPGNLAEIVREDLFQRLLRKLLRFTVGKVRQSDGQRAAGVLDTPDEMSVRRELGRRERDEEPYDQTEPMPEVAPVSDAERARLEAEIAEDPAIQTELAAALAARTAVTGGARGGYFVPAKPSRMSPEVLDELAASDAGARGVGGAIVLAAKVARALVRVVQRFRDGSDHGVYPTTVEELLRELYLAGLGAAAWQAIKKETRDTFAEPDPAHPRGGSYLLGALARALRGQAESGQRLPELTLVGHSTGAVFIDHLLAAVSEQRDRFPAGFRFRNVVFLAPACTFDHFAGTLAAADLIDRFRMFTMSDDSERADHLVPRVYPRSLLYLVAGALERDEQDRSAYRHIAGLARYVDRPPDAGPGVAAVRRYLAADPARLVLSPTPPDALGGLRSSATKHGGFAEDALVLASVQAMVGDRP
jgi:hypothetical protein